jgi:tripartite-type tricarboxylate transporter receptor subunit TctC
MHRRLLLLSAALAALGAAPALAADYPWQPDRPINIIVPWSAGGSTDQITRVVAPLIGEALGQSIVIVNQPGASGSIGTKAALDAPRDGYTWTANAIVDNALYAVSGLIENTSLDDYGAIYLHVANVPVVSVGADAPVKDMGELLELMRAGESVTVATAGVNSSGGLALAALNEAAGGKARLIAYDGGNPAVLAAASGETVATTQLAVEQVELIRGGRLRPLAVLSPEPLQVEGIDPIPSIREWLPDMPLGLRYFGILIPDGAPDEVYATVDRIWAEKVMDSPELKAYALEKGAVLAPAFGDEARLRVMAVATHDACAKAARGEAVIDPATIGITC